MHSKKQAQAGASIFNEASTEILAKYFDYSNVFSAENVAKLSKHTKINEHTIKLDKNKQSLFGPIYSLGQLDIKMLKIYIEINLANSFIRPFKSPMDTPILFD